MSHWFIQVISPFLWKVKITVPYLTVHFLSHFTHFKTCVHAMTGRLLCTCHMCAVFSPLSHSHTSWEYITHADESTSLYGAYEWLFMFCQIKHSSCELLKLSFYYSYGSAANSKTIKNSRLVSQKDDVHVCIMCLRAIMNYQVQDAQTWLITKTSGTSDLITHRKEAANKNSSLSSI